MTRGRPPTDASGAELSQPAAPGRPLFALARAILTEALRNASMRANRGQQSCAHGERRACALAHAWRHCPGGDGRAKCVCSRPVRGPAEPRRDGVRWGRKYVERCRYRCERAAPLPIGGLQGRPQGARQLQRQHRRRAGPGGVRRRASPGKAPTARPDLPRARPRDPRLRRDRRAGGRRRPGRDGCGHRRRAASAPTCCWSSATTTWAASPPAVSSSGSTA